MDYLNSLKVKGVVIGPLHINLKDDLAQTNLLAIDPKFGTTEEFQEVLQAAKKKGKDPRQGVEGAPSLCQVPNETLQHFHEAMF